MAIEFPTGVSNGYTFTASNGVVYTYDSSGGGGWTAYNDGSVADIYVKRSGDTMTGNLHVDTQVSTGDSSPWTDPSNLSGSVLDAGYLLQYRALTDDSGAFHACYNGNGGAPVFQVKTDGSGEFAGSSFNIGDYTFDSTTTSGAEFDSGSLTLQRLGSVGADSRSIAGRWGADINWEINVDGSATFEGDVYINTSADAGVYVGKVGYVTISHSDRDSVECLAITDVPNAANNFSVMGSGRGYFRNILEVGTTASNETGMIINPVGNGGTEATVYCAHGQATAPFNIYLGTAGLSGTSVSMQASGNAIFTGNVTAANFPSSDIKFKKNIAPANSQLSDVVALGKSLKNFDWKDNAPLNTELKAKRFLGLVAQEVEQISPHLTYEATRDGDTFKAINQDVLVMKLLGAVAEQNDLIEALKTEVQALKGGN